MKQRSAEAERRSAEYKQQSAEAERRSAEYKQQSAEAERSSADYQQQSEEALTSSLGNLVWFYKRVQDKTKEPIPPNEIQEWKNVAKKVFSRCNDINLNYKAVLRKELGDDKKVEELLKFYGVE